MILWRVYYGDGTTLDNIQCDVFHLPTQNVQAVVQLDSEVRRIVLHRFDYYCWNDSIQSWQGHDVAGFWEYLFHVQGAKYVLFGRTISNADYKRILHDAIADKDFKE